MLVNVWGIAVAKLKFIMGQEQAEREGCGERLLAYIKPPEQISIRKPSHYTALSSMDDISAAPIITNVDSGAQETTTSSEKDSSSRGGWGAAIFIICKTPHLTSSFFFTDPLLCFRLLMVCFVIWVCCSCRSGREVCLLWRGGEPHQLPHQCPRPVHGRSRPECQHLGRRLCRLPFDRRFCC